MGGDLGWTFGKMVDLGVARSKKNWKLGGHLGCEWGRHGSPPADTLGKPSRGLQEGF